MDVVVVGCKAVVPEETRVMAEAKVARLGRRSPVLERAEVRLTEDRCAPPPGRRVCEVTITGHGHVVRARAGSQELPAAIALAVDKLEHQVERLKGKLVGRSHPRHGREVARA